MDLDLGKHMVYWTDRGIRRAAHCEPCTDGPT